MRSPIAREAWPFALPLLLVTLALGFWRPWAALPTMVLVVFVLWFFRDPARTPPDDPAAVLSPADGRIIRADGEKISIFLNVFNVHVCRTPLAGRLISYRHIPGRFLAAFKDEASEENERAELEIEGVAGRIQVTLVAGLVARRIVPWVRAGDALATAQRVGLIRFGSRVDLELPVGTALHVRVGDRVTAGVTVLARFAGVGDDGSATANPV